MCIYCMLVGLCIIHLASCMCNRSLTSIGYLVSLKETFMVLLRYPLGRQSYLCHAFLQSMPYGWESKCMYVIYLTPLPLPLLTCRIHSPSHFKSKYNVDEVYYSDEVSYQYYSIFMCVMFPL